MLSLALAYIIVLLITVALQLPAWTVMVSATVFLLLAVLEDQKIT